MNPAASSYISFFAAGGSPVAAVAIVTLINRAACAYVMHWTVLDMFLMAAY